ncbi:MAG: hypothetical protein ABJN34_07385 [Litoreibacter sp.]|uniref:hypothetical protein n=1 Tax=Litoreibacter sp. TaxID=1969459 RepID=UPI003297E4C9
MTLDQDPELGPVLLGFYECLTDPDKLDSVMEMLTSWLDDEGGEVIAPKLDYHAEHAWRLLGQISTPEPLPAEEMPHLEQTYFKSQADVEQAIHDQIGAEDLKALNHWLSSKASTKALLMRVFNEQGAELAILSQAPTKEGFILKRTGAEFHSIISKFVSDSFDLTDAEFTLVSELISGGTLREISDRLGKSWETTRSQVKTLSNKLGVSSQGDILRIVHQAANLMPPQQVERTTRNGEGGRTLLRPDGRTICYEIDGPRSEKTLVHLHGLLEGRHWPEKARNLALRRGWQVIRISRAGRGASTVNAKIKDDLLQDHVDDVMAIVDHEGISSFSIYGAADGFSVGYPLALQHPERVQMIVGLEVTPPILSRDAIKGFSGKMKTFGLACLYAPKTVKFMFGLALSKMEKMEDRYSVVHPLLGIRLDEIEDADGIRAVEANFQDVAQNKHDGPWRDASVTCLDWAHASANTNKRPRAALIHCGNSMINSSEFLNDFAERIGAPIYRLDSYLPHVMAPLPLVLDTLEQL